VNTKILYTNNVIQNRVNELAKEITNYFKSKNNKPLLVIGVLNGCYLFFADLTRNLNLEVETEFIKISSYYNNKRSSNITFEYENLSKYNLKEYNILIIDDIVDTGISADNLLNYFIENYNLQKEQMVFCTLLYKRFKNNTEFVPDFVGFELDKDYFVIGYGMDDNNKCRNTNYIYYNN
jgi:hypoxanthine phosphoribosyltransferase